MNDVIYEKLSNQVERLIEALAKNNVYQEQVIEATSQIVDILNNMSSDQSVVAANLEEFLHGEPNCAKSAKDFKELIEDKRYTIKEFIENANVLLKGEDYNLMKIIKRLNFLLDTKTLVVGFLGTILTIFGAYELIKVVMK